MSHHVLYGDCRAILPTLGAHSVHAIITSPPYWGLRRYLPPGHPLEALEIGQEALHDCAGQQCGQCYICVMVQVFRACRRVLRADGVLWLNIGDSYHTPHKGGNWNIGRARLRADSLAPAYLYSRQANRKELPGLGPKQLLGMPWRLALALQRDGWILRCDVIWSKPNVLPESVRDRPHRAHEYLFMLTQSPRGYYYDPEAVREPLSPHTLSTTGTMRAVPTGSDTSRLVKGQRWARTVPIRRTHVTKDGTPTGANKRSVWPICSEVYREAHYAVMPQALVEPCLLSSTSEAGCCPACAAPWRRQVRSTRTLDGAPAFLGSMRKGDLHTPHTKQGVAHSRIATVVETLGWAPGCRCDAGDPVPCTVLDPFAGSGTVARVALRHRRHSIGMELNDTYAEQIERRCAGVQMTLPR